MLGILASFLGLIPGLSGLAAKIAEGHYNTQVKITQAKVGGDRDVAVAIVNATATGDHEQTARLGLVTANKILTLLVVAFATPLIVFEWKVVIYDIVLNLGSTDPIRGQVADWATTIIAFIFGAPVAAGGLSLLNAWLNKRGT